MCFHDYARQGLQAGMITYAAPPEVRRAAAEKGAAKAKAQGRRLGRRPVYFSLERLAALRSQGLTIAKAAHELGVSVSTAHRALRGAKNAK